MPLTHTIETCGFVDAHMPLTVLDFTIIMPRKMPKNVAWLI
jgi:hypothetical protein